ncbi:MAG: hypothetical protein ACRC28_14210 [Clostridium sp.]|uniref:hypothetical protein n=1 Tax=Clostridium sp. TaxID=1506 RepID=UPI003F412D2E
MINDKLYKQFISKENYIKKKKEKDKKENSILIIILVINIIISFRVVAIFNKKDKEEEIQIEYNEKENLIRWIEQLDENVEKARIDKGRGEIIVSKENINEMLNKFEIDNIQLEKEELAKLKVRGLKYGD